MNNTSAARQPRTLAWIVGVMLLALLTGAFTAPQARADGIRPAAVAGTASISGKVSVPAGVKITARSYSVAAYDVAGKYVGYREVGLDGTYSITGLSAGSYKLSFTIGPWINVLSQWFSGKSSFEQATPVALSAGQKKTGVNVTLVKGASISGKVSVPAGVKIASDIEVTAWDAENNWVGNAYVAANGSYSVNRLPAGTYRLHFAGDKIATQWYGGKASFKTATAVVVGAGQAKTGVNITLAKGAVISGKVTVPAREVIDGGTYWAYAYGADPTAPKYGVVEDNGTYSIKGLAAGSYKLEFKAPSWKNVASQWYNGKTLLSSATPVAVATGQAKTGINVTLVKGASISGKVTLPSGVKIQPSNDGKSDNRHTVTVYDADQRLASETVLTSADGKYSFTALPAGKYKLSFTGPGVVTQWYKGKSSMATATTIAVTVGQAKTGVNVTMVRPSVSASTPKISGSAVVGKKLTASAGKWTSGAKLTYQWYAQTSKISGATKSTFTVTKAQLAKKITVKVTGSKSGYTTVSKTSASTAAVKAK